MVYNKFALGLALTLLLATTGGHAQSVCDVMTDCFVDDPTCKNSTAYERSLAIGHSPSLSLPLASLCLFSFSKLPLPTAVSMFGGAITCDHSAAETFCDTVEGFSEHCTATCKSCVPFPTCPIPEGMNVAVKPVIIPNTNTVNVYLQTNIEVYGAQMTLMCADSGAPITITEGKAAPDYDPEITVATNGNLALMFSLSGKHSRRARLRCEEGGGGEKKGK